MDEFTFGKRRWTANDAAQLLISKTALSELDLDDAKKLSHSRSLSGSSPVRY